MHRGYQQAVDNPCAKEYPGAREARERNAAAGRERAARAAGAKREGHLRFPSLFELLPFPQQPRERALRPYFVGNSHQGTGIGFRFPRGRGVIAADFTGFA